MITEMASIIVRKIHITLEDVCIICVSYMILLYWYLLILFSCEIGYCNCRGRKGLLLASLED